MAHWRITCDRSGGFVRAALWQGKILTGLYVDREDSPDMTGAIVRARAIRVASGGQKAWFDADLSQTIYVEGIKDLRAGDWRTLQVRTTRGQGKGWSGKSMKGYEAIETKGLIVPPPPVWARAMADVPPADKATLAFENHEDWRLCEALLAQDQTAGRFSLKNRGRDKLHPDLDDVIDTLRVAHVPLQGGGEIVIEQTEALVAIDVNAGEASNPTAVNLQAVREIARQIRLRNLSGMIIVDALKMPTRADTSKLINAFERAVEADPAGVRLFGMTKLGLVELTRTRRGPSLQEVMGT